MKVFSYCWTKNSYGVGKNMAYILDISLAYGCVGGCVYMCGYKDKTISEGFKYSFKLKTTWLCPLDVYPTFFQLLSLAHSHYLSTPLIVHKITPYCRSCIHHTWQLFQ